MMTLQEFIEKLLSIPPSQRLAFMREWVPLLDERDQDQIAEGLKEKVVFSLKGNTLEAIEVADLLLQFSAVTKNERHRAMGLRAKAQALMLGKGDIKGAMVLYEEAIEIHQRHYDALGEALVYLTSIWGLVCLGRVDEAVLRGEWALTVLRQEGRLRDLATLYNNLALVHKHVGRYSQALGMLNEASQIYHQLGEKGQSELPLVEGNRALTLSYIGRFQEAIEAGEKAVELAEKLGQMTVKARNLHNSGIAYLVQGQYNQALQLYSAAHEMHLASEQPHEAALCELSTVEGLLLLRRFNEALRKAEQIIPFFQDKGMNLEESLARLYQAYAFKDLGQLDHAVQALEEARALYQRNSLHAYVATCDLGIAHLYFKQGDWRRALEIASQCVRLFGEFENDRMQGLLLVAEINLQLGHLEASERILHEVVTTSEACQWRWLVYQGLYLLGRLAWLKAEPERAIAYLEKAVLVIERLRGNIMMEFRADFLEDKQKVYESLIELCLLTSQEKKGLQYVERSKSRALLELLAFRPDLSVRALDDSDQATVEKIHHLRSLREERIRFGINLVAEGTLEKQTQSILVQQEVQEIEKQITELWHHLLVKNADYAREAALWEVQSEDVQPYLEPGTVLIEYFTLQQKVCCFLVTPASAGEDDPVVQSFSLEIPMAWIEEMLQRFWVNLTMVSRPGFTHHPSLLHNANGILNLLYKALVAPLQPFIQHAPNLIIVPHDALHYLPFHALVNEGQYLIQEHQVSYLPNAGLLKYGANVHRTVDEVLVIGHSFGKKLLHTLEEAKSVAALWETHPLLEETAQTQSLREKASQVRLLHLACHGDFRPDNPLFSGLALDDGWLTTLDIFNLRLQASLVTLSACQTGRSVVGGGDELFGLMRAFLSAGASSLLLTLWPVADEATEHWMGHFYRALMQAQTKKAAVQAAVQTFLASADPKYRHPYFWAPFILVGHDGLL